MTISNEPRTALVSTRAPSSGQPSAGVSTRAMIIGALATFIAVGVISYAGYRSTSHLD